MRFAVVQFGGSNCDRDVVHVLSEVCGVDTDLIWHKEGLKRAYDAVIIPGGFWYCDYPGPERSPHERQSWMISGNMGPVVGWFSGSAMGRKSLPKAG